MRRALLLALLFAAPATAHAGQFAVDCERTVRKQADPIVHPGEPWLSHLHDFFGPRSVPDDAGTPGARPLSSFRSSCALTQDRSTYWMPVLYGTWRGKRRPVGRAGVLQAYYRYGPATQPFPEGFELVAGDAARTETDPRASSWSCWPDGIYGYTQPPACPQGKWLLVEVDFPSCYDGHHVAYPVDAVCPDGHVELPRLVFFRTYGPLARPFGRLSLSSGSPGGLHGDFISGWDPDVLRYLMASCPVDCGHVRSDPG